MNLEDLDLKEMPKEHKEIELDIKLTESELETIRNTKHIAEDMEDKWHIIFDDNKLYYYRSWTGFCVYIIYISEDGIHKAIVNRCDEQYTEKSDLSDKYTIESYIMYLLGRTAEYIELSDKAFDAMSKNK